MLKIKQFSLFCFLLITIPLYAEHQHHSHKEKDLMFSYQLMNMHMDGMRSGQHNLSSEAVASTPNPLGGELMHMGDLADGSPRLMKVPNDYRIAPLEMDMKMHMFGFMYGISDQFSLMLMLNYVDNKMTMKTFKGRSGTTEIGTFTGHTSGMGDSQLSTLINLQDLTHLNLNLNIGLNLPTGSISEKGKVLPPFAGSMGTAINEKVQIDRLPYPMQLGTGTYDLLLGSTYNGQQADLSWGAQVNLTLPLDHNHHGYHFGNKLTASAWVVKKWFPMFSNSIRLSALSQGKLHGRDQSITGGNPLSTPANTGRDTLFAYLGANFKNFAFELGMPLYEKVNGLQMSQDWTANIGWQITF